MKNYFYNNIYNAFEYKNKNVIQNLINNSTQFEKDFIIKYFSDLNEEKQKDLFDLDVNQLNNLIIFDVIKNPYSKIKLNRNLIFNNINIINDDNLIELLNYSIIYNNNENKTIAFDLLLKEILQRNLNFDKFDIFKNIVENSNEYAFNKILPLLEKDNYKYFKLCINTQSDFINLLIEKYDLKKLLFQLNEIKSSNKNICLFIDQTRNKIENLLLKNELKNDIHNKENKTKRKI